MNPRVGEYEIQAIQQMTDDDFELYLDNAVMLYCQSQGPMPPHVFRSLLVLLRYCDEEGDLAERQGKGEGPKTTSPLKIGAGEGNRTLVISLEGGYYDKKPAKIRYNQELQICQKSL